MAELGVLARNLAFRVGGALIPNQYWPPEGVLFPCGHAVASSAPAHVKHLSPVPSPHKFQADLDFLCRSFRALEPQDLEHLVADTHSNTPPQSFILSFDDGLRECYEVIAPMLSRQGLPAMFFVNSATIGNNRLMWRHKISLLIERSREFPGRVPPQLGLAAGENLEQKLRRLRFTDEGLIDEVAEFLEVDFDDYLRTVRPYLTTEQLLELSSAGFVVGAHSDSHAYFQELPMEDQKREISTCVARIRNLGLECRYFAFPFHDEEITLQVFEQLRELGVILTFGTSEARVDSVRFSYQRFSIEASSVPTVLKQLSVKAFLRRVMGTELMSRSD